MSLFDENIIKKDLSPRTILETYVSRVVKDLYHDIQYRINNGQIIFQLHPEKIYWSDIKTTNDVWMAFRERLQWELETLKERLCIHPIEWNDAKLNISSISSVLAKKEKIIVDIYVDYTIFKPKRLIGEPSILDMECVSYQYIFEEFKRPLKKPKHFLYECI